MFLIDIPYWVQCKNLMFIYNVWQALKVIRISISLNIYNFFVLGHSKAFLLDILKYTIVNYNHCYLLLTIIVWLSYRILQFILIVFFVPNNQSLTFPLPCTCLWLIICLAVNLFGSIWMRHSFKDYLYKQQSGCLAYLTSQNLGNTHSQISTSSASWRV